MPDRCRRNIFLAQRTQRSQLTQILESVNFALADEPRSFPPLQLAGTDLQNPQHILAAKAVHSSMLRWSHPGIRRSAGFELGPEKSVPGFAPRSWRSSSTKEPLSIMCPLKP